MWYFQVNQEDLRRPIYQTLQKMAVLTEVEIFNEPYHNWCIFQVERSQYVAFIEILDSDGVAYQATTDRPLREELLAGMR
ncbi:hypothetical protein [Arsenicibacter rosenii]|uniref:Uncharacterized protein n=1 Tax=Arsenicibacter rosenii TaxID=1750698 RepID=A0A1S2VCV6_9BACT|nr:hypothetical protein [Arsenicibacter rosenii]OIN56533.1 hypothetical protein BLX24_23980 [Arsenicibacter rosenii]